MMPPFCAKAASSPTVRMGNALALSKMPHSGCFRIADEKDLALAGVIRASDLPDDDGTAANALACHGAFQSLAEFAFAAEADGDGCVAAGKCVGRPIDVFGEVQQEKRLDLILRQGLLGSANQADSTPKAQAHTPRDDTGHPVLLNSPPLELSWIFMDSGLKIAL
jgi:hypothetical protein